MKLNLDDLKTEIAQCLKAEGFAVFHASSEVAETASAAYWDTDRHPDFREFLAAAREAGTKLVAFHQQQFGPEHIEDALARLDESALPPETLPNYERRLREMQAYEGFTCLLQIFFDRDGRTFVFDVRTDWYEEYLDIVATIDGCPPMDDDEDDGESMGGYYSRN